MERYRAARGAVVAGLATIAIAAWYATQPAIDCGSGEVSSASALSAFQMAKSQPALDAAIGCTQRLEVLTRINRVDLVAFIASWGLFLGLGALALADGRLRRVALVFIGLAVVGDVVETATQLWIATRWPFVSSPMLVLLAAGSAMKWAGIGFGLGAIGLSAARERPATTRWLGVGIAVFGLLGLLVFTAPGGSVPPFTGIAFLLLVGACVVNARRA